MLIAAAVSLTMRALEIVEIRSVRVGVRRGGVTAMPTASFRRMMAVLAGVVLVIGAAIQHERGRPWPSALAGATPGALSGLACWWTYHLISRRNNGAILCSDGMILLNDPRPAIGPAAIAWLLLVNVLIGALAGAFDRGWSRRQARRGRP